MPFGCCLGKQENGENGTCWLVGSQAIEVFRAGYPLHFPKSSDKRTALFFGKALKHTLNWNQFESLLGRSKNILRRTTPSRGEAVDKVLQFTLQNHQNRKNISKKGTFIL